MGVRVTCYRGDKPGVFHWGHTRKKALAKHRNEHGTGKERAKYPARGCYMMARREEDDMWSAHGQGRAGRWGLWCPTFNEAREAAGLRYD